MCVHEKDPPNGLFPYMSVDVDPMRSVHLGNCGWLGRCPWFISKVVNIE